VQIEILPLLSDNYGYIVICQRSGVAAVVDPAEAEPVRRALSALGVDLVAVWNTHHHWDHTAGNAGLVGDDVELYAHVSDRARIPGVTHPVEHDDRFRLGQLEVRVIHAPGHTRGGVVYQVEDAAFTGDALFGAGCGRLFEGDPPTMYHSLNERIACLPAATRVFCGHEYTQKNLAYAATVEPSSPALAARISRVESQRSRAEPSVPSTLDEESATNPFLRCSEPGIAATLSQHFPDDDFADPVRVFARLRQLRDQF
jgi:hydroxyacylglutathione hydrolase